MQPRALLHAVEVNARRGRVLALGAGLQPLLLPCAADLICIVPITHIRTPGTCAKLDPRTDLICGGAERGQVLWPGPECVKEKLHDFQCHQ